MKTTRGARGNPPNRYESTRTEPFDDGWGPDDAPPPPLRTTVTNDASRNVLTRNESPDVPFDRSVNPYRGCEHGCAYCFARPSHAWLGLSPGLDFESRLLAKPEAARLLAAALRRPSYRCAPIAIGSNTDAYQPVERRLGITRAVLEVLAEFRHPVMITTKAALVERDLDLLAPMAAQGLVRVAVSVTTLDRDLARRLEPRAATPQRRLATVRALAGAGVPTAVMVAPVIPGLTDHETEAILAAAAAAGADHASHILLRLPFEVKEIMAEWLAEHHPRRAARVLALLRDSRAGRLYDSAFGSRRTGSGAYAEMLAQRFRIAARRLGLDDAPAPLRIDLFRVPPRAGDQLGLFD